MSSTRRLHAGALLWNRYVCGLNSIPFNLIVDRISDASSSHRQSWRDSSGRSACKWRDPGTLAICHRCQASCLTRVEMAFRLMGRYSEAIEANRQAIALYSRALGPDHEWAVSALTRLAATTSIEVGRYAEAKAIIKHVPAVDAIGINECCCRAWVPGQ
jgi:hypothetical protein